MGSVSLAGSNTTSGKKRTCSFSQLTCWSLGLIPHPLVGSFLHVCSCCRCSDFKMSAITCLRDSQLSGPPEAASCWRNDPTAWGDRHGRGFLASALKPSSPTAPSQSLASVSVPSPGKPSHQKRTAWPQARGPHRPLSLSPTQQHSCLLSPQRPDSPILDQGPSFSGRTGTMTSGRVEANPLRVFSQPNSRVTLRLLAA